MTATTSPPSTEIAVAEPLFTNTERLALAGFLAGYTLLTRDAYALDLRQYASWVPPAPCPAIRCPPTRHRMLRSRPGGSGPGPGHGHTQALHNRRVLPVRRRGRAAGSLPGGPCPPTPTGLRVARHWAGPLPISAPSQPGPKEPGSDTDHPCIKRYALLRCRLRHAGPVAGAVDLPRPRRCKRMFLVPDRRAGLSAFRLHGIQDHGSRVASPCADGSNRTNRGSTRRMRSGRRACGSQRAQTPSDARGRAATDAYCRSWRRSPAPAIPWRALDASGGGGDVRSGAVLILPSSSVCTHSPPLAEYEDRFHSTIRGRWP
jgi:hypothetical protein